MDGGAGSGTLDGGAEGAYRIHGLGERLRDARQLAGLTQAELARDLGLEHVTQVARWEAERYVPGTRYVVALARALDVTTDYLLGLTPSGSGEL